MKKIIALFIGLLCSVLLIAPLSYGYEESHWTLEADGFQYYNQDIVFDSTNGMNYAFHELSPWGVYSELWIQYDQYNDGLWTFIPADTLGTYYLNGNVKNVSNGMMTYDVAINDIVLAVNETTGTDSAPVVYDIQVRVRFDEDASLSDPEPAANRGGVWRVADENRVYVHMRYGEGSSEEWSMIETATATETLDPDVGTYAQAQVREHFTPVWSDRDYDPNNLTSLSFPNADNLYEQTVTMPLNYDYEFYIEIMYHESNNNIVVLDQFERMEMGYIDTVTVELSSGIRNGVPVNAVRILSDGWLLYDSGDVILDGYDEETGAASWVENRHEVPRISMYWERQTYTNDPIDVTNSELSDPWSQLPSTTGRPSNPSGDWGYISGFHFNPTNHTVNFTVSYMGEHFSVLPFTVTADDYTFLSEAKQIKYYTSLQGDRILYINFHEDESTLLLANSSFEDVTEWRGEALWNLTQNDVHVTNAVTYYAYIPEIDQDGNVYAYFYMPNIDVDDLISVTSVLTYRYWNHASWDVLGLFDMEPGETTSMTVTSTKGESSSVNPTWVESTYQSVGIATPLLAMATAAAFVPVYGWAVAAAGIILTGVLYAADNLEWFAYDVDQIEHVIPSPNLTDDINTYIRTKPNAQDFNPGTDELYKLHLATLQDGDRVEIIEDMSDAIQIVWESNGSIFVANEPYIKGDFMGPGTETPPDVEGIAWLGLIPILVSGGVALLIIVTGVFKAGVMTRSGVKLSRFIPLVILAVIIGLLLYFSIDYVMNNIGFVWIQLRQ